MTTEQISRCFAMYLGCKMQKQDVEGALKNEGLSTITNSIVYSYDDRGYAQDHTKWFKLLLRPLSALLPEHAIEVARILKVTYSNQPDSEAFFDITGLTYYLTELFEQNGDMREIPSYRIVTLFQKLIEWGYSVPLECLNGLDPITAGLAIEATTLKTNEHE